MTNTTEEAKAHQDALDNEYHIEFWAEYPDLEPILNDSCHTILADFHQEYLNRGDMYDEEMGELFHHMMERYKKMEAC